MEQPSLQPAAKTGVLYRLRARLSIQVLAYLALVGGILALSLSSLFVRWAEAAGTVTSFYRMALAMLVLLPFYWKQKERPLRSQPGLILLVAAGGTLSAMDHAVWSTALGFTRIANATLLNNIAPLWVALVAFLFWKERLSGRFWLGLVLTLAGAGVVFGNDLINDPHLGRGDLLAIISSLFYAGFYLVTQRARQQLNTLSYIWPVCVTASLVLLVVNLIVGNPLGGYSPATYLSFLGAGLISQVFGYFAIGFALGHLPAALVAPTMIAQPVITALLAIPLAGEGLLPAQWLGGLTVLTGIYLVNRK